MEEAKQAKAAAAAKAKELARLAAEAAKAQKASDTAMEKEAKAKKAAAKKIVQRIGNSLQQVEDVRQNEDFHLLPEWAAKDLDGRCNVLQCIYNDAIQTSETGKGINPPMVQVLESIKYVKDGMAGCIGLLESSRMLKEAEQ